MKEKLNYIILWVFSWMLLGSCVDRSNFKACKDSSFCRRNRAIQPGGSPFTLLSDTLRFESDSITGDIYNTNTNISFKLTIDTLQKETARIRITELSPIRPRYTVQETLVREPQHVKYEKLESDSNGFKIKFGNSVMQVLFKPLKVNFFDADGVLLMSLNNKGLLNFEHYRVKNSSPQESPEKKNESEKTEDADQNSESEEKEDHEEEKPVESNAGSENIDEKGMWEETFKDHTDSKPYGPSSVGFDLSFIGFEHVYGIPQHADSLSLKQTSGGEPYRLYNLDVFEYELNNPMALYGSIPFMTAHSAYKTVGIFFNNAAEQWIDISSSKSVLNSLISFFKSGDTPEVDTHWMAESGIIDLFVMLGPKPHDVLNQYSTITGTQTLPPMFAVAYHQCRWNYNDEDDVKNVDAGFDEHDIPYDVIWLDIEHTDGKKYFTWDGSKFPDSKRMIDHVASKGRKMVTIVDPHIKRVGGYHIHTEAESKQFYVKKKDGADYEGWCWPGSSSWIDFTNPDARNWWASKFYLDQYQGSTLDLFTWNDMNEPSVFNGPEVTMHKDAIHYGNWEHRDVHNIYGMLQHMSTFEGHLLRSEGKLRPFILSRSFFAGSQRAGAHWTGDNTADWGHLKMSIPMLLSLNVAGFPFVGADVGGFFGNPDSELLVRWYQMATFFPFFRAHAHIDTRRREPWLFGEDNTRLIQRAVQKRYMILPYIYTLMRNSFDTGMAVMRPIWMEYPSDVSTFAVDDAFMMGNSLLVKPVTEASQQEVLVYFPGGDNQIWYDFDTFKRYSGGTSEKIPTPMDKVPVFIRGGTILPMKWRMRRSSALMANDPYTLVIALDHKEEAEGDLYIDDGHTLDYKDKKFIKSKISMSASNIQKWDTHSNYKTKAWVERIVVLGIKQQPKSCLAMLTNDLKSLLFSYDSAKQLLVIKKPSPYVDQNFSISLSY